eukprot:13427690-Alexandrium_andersonii.AAC.1
MCIRDSFPFLVASDSTLSFRPSEVSEQASTKKKPSKNLTEVCDFFSSSGNLQTHLTASGENASAWNSAAP